MSSPDLNLLVTLDTLLTESSVARAARRLRLSPSAMSRALARVRDATGDPILVRSGRGLVATPRALELRDPVSRIVREATVVLSPQAEPDLARVVRSFTLRTSDGFVEAFGPAIHARVAAAAPGIRLRFVQKADKDGASLRDGAVDLETGILEATTSPQLLSRGLFQDRLIGVARARHPLAKGKITPARYARSEHVTVSRQMLEHGPIGDALRALGLEHQSALVVGGFSAALALARASDLVATVPERHTATLRAGMHTFTLPFATPRFTVSMLWHARLDSDAVHRWLRRCVGDACARRTPP